MSLPLKELHYVSFKLSKLKCFLSEKMYQIHVSVMRAQCQCQCHDVMPSPEGYSFNSGYVLM